MFLYTVPGPVSGVSATPGVVQVNISWNPPLQPNGAIINYEVGFTIGTGAFSYNNTLATHFVLEQLPLEWCQDCWEDSSTSSVSV